MNRGIRLTGWLCLVMASGWVGLVSAQEQASRTWSDASGAFQLQATLVQRTADSVTLKKSDGSQVTVPLQLLSAADQAYVAQWSPPEAKPAVVLKDLTAADHQALAAGEPVLIGGAEPLGKLSADPAAQVMKYQRLQVLAAQTDAYDKIGMPIVVDPSTGRLLVSVGRHVAGQSESQRGRLFRTQYGARRAEVLIDAPESLDVLDRHPASGRSLAVCGKDQLYRGGELALLQEAEGSMTVVLRRSLPGIDQPGFKPDVQWGRLLDANTAVLLIDSTLWCVDLVNNETHYTVANLAAGGRPGLSPGGRYLAIPASGQVTLLNPRDGTPLGSLSVEGSLTPSVQFDPAGSKLLIARGNQLAIWNLTQGRFDHEVTTLNPLGEVIGWVQRHLVLTQLAGLIDSELEMTVWHYGLPPGGHVQAIFNGILAANSSSAGLVIQTLPVPHASMAKLQQRLGQPASLLIQPGSRVAVEVQALPGVDPQPLQAAVTAAAERVGWEVDPAAPIKLVALIGRGEKRELQYTQRRLGANAQESTTTTVSITPFTAQFEIRGGNQVLWSRNTTNHVPPMFFLRDGQSLQEEVSKFERPDAAFFERLSLPPRIPKPAIAQAIGRSRIQDGQWVE